MIPLCKPIHSAGSTVVRKARGKLPLPLSSMNQRHSGSVSERCCPYSGDRPCPRPGTLSALCKSGQDWLSLVFLVRIECHFCTVWQYLIRLWQVIFKLIVDSSPEVCYSPPQLCKSWLTPFLWALKEVISFLTLCHSAFMERMQLYTRTDSKTFIEGVFDPHLVSHTATNSFNEYSIYSVWMYGKNHMYCKPFLRLFRKLSF